MAEMTRTAVIVARALASAETKLQFDPHAPVKSRNGEKVPSAPKTSVFLGRTRPEKRFNRPFTIMPGPNAAQVTTNTRKRAFSTRSFLKKFLNTSKIKAKYATPPVAKSIKFLTPSRSRDSDNGKPLGVPNHPLT
jgi:hypothetical protein